MKLVIIVCIIILSGVIGYWIKLKYKNQKDFLVFIKNFLEFALIGVDIYKNNLQEIINNYKFQQKNKNAKYVKIFQKTANPQPFNVNFVDEYIFDSVYLVEIKNFFNCFGKMDKESESEKIKKQITSLESMIKSSEKLEKEKGDLYFKISLAIGVILGVIIW